MVIKVSLKDSVQILFHKHVLNFISAYLSLAHLNKERRNRNGPFIFSTGVALKMYQITLVRSLLHHNKEFRCKIYHTVPELQHQALELDVIF